jgi:hypothetical protein
MRSNQRKVLIQRKEIAYNAPSGGEALSSDRLSGTWVMRFSKVSGLSASSSPMVEIALRDELAVRDARWSEGQLDSRNETPRPENTPP